MASKFSFNSLLLVFVIATVFTLSLTETISFVDAHHPEMTSAKITSLTTIDVTFSANLDFKTIDIGGGDFSVTCNTVSNAVEGEKKKIVTLTLENELNTSDIPKVTLNPNTSISKTGNSDNHVATGPLYITPDAAYDKSTTSDMTCSLDSGDSTITIGNDSSLSTITVPDNVSDPVLKFDSSTFVNSTDVATATLTNELIINSDSVNVTIPSNTEISNDADSPVWDGQLELPTSTSVTVSGYDTLLAIQFGSSDTILTFTNPISIILSGQTGLIAFITEYDGTQGLIPACTVNIPKADDIQKSFPQACFVDDGTDLTIYTLTASTFSSGSTISSSSGSSNQHKTRPTFGVDHSTFKQIVDGGFTFNDESLDINHNFWTPFEQQTIKIGQTNMFSAKVFASQKLMVQEFLFGIPSVGMAHNAELGIEVFYNDDGDIKAVNVVQKTDITDIDTLQVIHKKSKCQRDDDTEVCDSTYLFIKFLEPLQYDVMALKAIDFKNRVQITYLNDGFDVTGESLNPMKTMMIPGPEKYEGLIEVTRTAKYSNIWESQDGRIFESNDYDTFKWINQYPDRTIDDGVIKNNSNSESVLYKQAEIEKAMILLNQMCEKCADKSYGEIYDIFTHVSPEISKTFSSEEKSAQHEIEIEKAMILLNQMCEKCADKSYGEIYDIFTYEYPETSGSKYDNPELLKLLLAEEKRAQQLLE